MPVGQEPVVYANVPPDLIVEVRSPGNPGSHLATKVREYLASGVPLVWIVDPETETVTVYRRPEEGRALFKDAQLTGDDAPPGFTCKVADFFE